MYRTFWSKNLNVKHNLEDQGLDKRILKWISKEIRYEDLAMIRLVQIRDC
jgi:hypothetical protein